MLTDSSFGGCVLVQTWKWEHSLASSPQASPQLLSHLPGSWGCSVQMKERGKKGPTGLADARPQQPQMEQLMTDRAGTSQPANRITAHRKIPGV